MSDNEFKPKAGESCLYKESGGVNWFLCKVIAFHGDKVWLNNLSVGSTPVKQVDRVKFTQLDKDTVSILKNLNQG